VAELVDVFLKDDLHFVSLCSCHSIYFAALTEGCAALEAPAARARTTLKPASCLLLKGGSCASRTPKLLADLKIGRYIRAAMFLALRLALAPRVALVVLAREVVALRLVGACLPGLPGAGRGCPRHCRRRALGQCCGRA